MDRCNPAAPVMRGVNSPLFTEGALIRDPRAVPNLCKADSGLSAMFGILAAISSHLVARCKILSYTCSCPIALRLRERRAKEQEFFGVGCCVAVGLLNSFNG